MDLEAVGESEKERKKKKEELYNNKSRTPTDLAMYLLSMVCETPRQILQEFNTNIL